MKGILNLPEDVIEQCNRNVEEFNPLLKKQGKSVGFKYLPMGRMSSCVSILIKIGKKSYVAKADWISSIA